MTGDILLVGSGALATLFAARLSESGHSVHVLGTWEQGLNALRLDGARILDPSGKGRAYKVHATNDPSEVAGIRNAIVLVKAWQTGRAAVQLQQALADDGVAVTLQNGLGNRETLVHRLGAARVSAGVITAGATLLGPGLVRAGGEGMISMERNQAIGPLEAALCSSRFQVQVVDDARSLIWGKLVISAAINPLTALLRVPNGELLTRSHTRRMMAALACETAEVAASENVQLPFSDPVEAAEDVARRTAANHSSMFQDVCRGAPTEIDAICGAIVLRGEEHGVLTPYNRACWKFLRAVASLN